MPQGNHGGQSDGSGDAHHHETHGERACGIAQNAYRLRAHLSVHARSQTDNAHRRSGLSAFEDSTGDCVALVGG
jgi:hypothetical protein